MERLDPNEGRAWETLSQHERDFYECALELVLLHANNDMIAWGAKAGE